MAKPKKTVINRSNKKHFKEWEPEPNCIVCQPSLRWKDKKYRPKEWARLGKFKDGYGQD